MREEITQGKSQSSSTAPPPPSMLVPRRMARRVPDDEVVSIQDFFRLKTPKFKGEEVKDPQEFLKETKKMVQRLHYFDAREIELVGIMMKRNAWDWYQRHIEDQLYSGNPPSWEEFKQVMMDECLTLVERHNRALQFERLRQLPGVSIADYAREFI